MRNQKAMMDETFKFKIGDVVALRVTAESIDSEFALNGPYDRDRHLLRDARVGAPTAHIVIGRVLEECHGGVQMHYRISMEPNNVDGRYFGNSCRQVHEFEVMPYTEAVEMRRKFIAPVTAK